jgi:hypothetical protein
MSIVITINQKGAKLEKISDLVRSAVYSKYPDAQVTVERKEPPKSRSERFVEAQSQLENAKSIAEELKDELQEWYDNLPENLQSGSKADELQSAIDELDNFVNSCDDAGGADVQFPQMF